MTPHQVAEQFRLPVRTVRRLLQRCKESGQEGLAPDYHRCGKTQPGRMPKQVRDEAVALRHEHPTWGAGFIRVVMKENHPRRALPAKRTLERWLRAEGLMPAPAGRRQAGDPGRATQPHQVWQMDAKDQMALANGRASWLRVVDEFSGAVLHTKVFSESSFGSVGPWAVRDELRKAFSLWGRPEMFRVDNGAPWGSSSDFPPDLALWILGLEIDMHWNPPRQPQKNGVVERSQGVGKNWGEPQTCDSARELQTRMRKIDRLQREAYPVAGDQSRIEAYPGLKHSGRRYSATWETRHWSFPRVVEHLAGYDATRRVDRGGKVSIYERPYHVGVCYAGETVHVYFDPDQLHWVFAREDGTQIRSKPTQEISATNIKRLEVTNRRNSQVRRPK